MRLDNPIHPTEMFLLFENCWGKKKDQFWPGDEPLLSPEEMLH